jgi:hypothetical protein
MYRRRTLRAGRPRRGSSGRLGRARCMTSPEAGDLLLNILVQLVHVLLVFAVVVLDLGVHRLQLVEDY